MTEYDKFGNLIIDYCRKIVSSPGVGGMVLKEVSQMKEVEQKVQEQTNDSRFSGQMTGPEAKMLVQNK